MENAVVLITTTDDIDVAEAIAHDAVDRRLAACVQIVGPITSVYRWQGKIETAKEFRCELKTTLQHVAELESLIRELHTYDVPEIVVLAATYVSADYGQWLNDQLAKEQES